VAAASQAGSRSSGKMIVTIVLAVIAIVAIVAGIMYFAEPAKSLPSVLGSITSPASRANAHRPLRGAAAVIVGVLCLVGAFFTRRSRAAAAS
jgi:uncharacterized membrane protein HdeD (DUF308 family)